MRGAARHDHGGRSAVSGPRPSDRNIAIVTEGGAGIYKPSRHVDLIRDSFERQGKEPEAFVGFHVRRLEALRRAGHTERIDADHWRVPNDIVERGMAHDLSQGGDSLRVRTLSTLDLEQQIGSDGATWLDRELVASTPMPLVKTGFGRDVARAGPARGAAGRDRPCQVRSRRILSPPEISWPRWSARRSSGGGRRQKRAVAPSIRPSQASISVARSSARPISPAGATP
jgi:hypothetical protein